MATVLFKVIVLTVVLGLSSSSLAQKITSFDAGPNGT